MTRMIRRDKIIGWLETVCNRRTELWMKTAVRDELHYRPWMRSAVIAPTEQMNVRYVLRTLGLILAGIAVGQLAIFVFGLAGLYVALIYYRAHTLHGGTSLPSAHEALAAYNQAMEVVMPLYGCIACTYPAITLIWLRYRAYFWNRRAQRLQANPMPFVQDLGAWPPPPRIS